MDKKKISEINFGKIKKFALLGGSQKILFVSKYLISKNIPIKVFSSTRLLAEKMDSGLSLEQELKKAGIEFYNSPNINNDQNLADFIDDGTVGLSIGGPWIVKFGLISLFKGKILNLHDQRLPENRGGGGFSWIILMGEKTGRCTLHLIDEGIDSGDIISVKKFVFGPKCLKPIDYYKKILKEDESFVTKFIDKVLAGKSFKKIVQNEEESTYWPRLNTKINGYINWSWSAEEIKKFICAFDDPYDGASTFLNKKRVFLKNCSVFKSKYNFHPFQAGLVFKITAGKFFVAAVGGIVVVEKVLDETGNDVGSLLRVGDRFVTSSDFLDSALETRIIYTPEGLKNSDEKTNDKK
ncbi:MAG: formyltransferase family protein [Candidatus Paceibacterota bacterium]